MPFAPFQPVSDAVHRKLTAGNHLHFSAFQQFQKHGIRRTRVQPLRRCGIDGVLYLNQFRFVLPHKFLILHIVHEHFFSEIGNLHFRSILVRNHDKQALFLIFLRLDMHIAKIRHYSFSLAFFRSRIIWIVQNPPPTTSTARSTG